QAEDGIRDRNVTGVQTCALPIYSMRFIHIQQYIIILLLQSDQTTEIGLITVHTENTFGYNNYSIIPGMIGNQQLFQLFVPVMPRSEERRVGKEGSTTESQDRGTR